MHTGVVLAVLPASAGQITPSPLSSTMHSEIPGKQKRSTTTTHQQRAVHHQLTNAGERVLSSESTPDYLP